MRPCNSFHVPIKCFLFFLSVLIFLPPAIRAQTAREPLLVFGGSFEQLQAAAQKEQKAFVVHLETSWCGVCKQMRAQTYRHPDVIAELNKGFVFYKMDAESAAGKPLADKHKVKAYPTLLYFNSAGKLMGKIDGLQDPDFFLFNLEKYAKAQQKALKKMAK